MIKLWSWVRVAVPLAVAFLMLWMAFYQAIRLLIMFSAVFPWRVLWIQWMSLCAGLLADLVSPVGLSAVALLGVLLLIGGLILKHLNNEEYGQPKK